MKLIIENTVMEAAKSLPTRGAWIETHMQLCAGGTIRSLPTRGAWIETKPPRLLRLCLPSLPTRGAWIETPNMPIPLAKAKVAPHTGGVD